MSIQKQIDNDFKQALKNKEQGIISTLRLLLAALKNEQINKKAELNDDDIIKVLKSEVKKRKESIVEYENGQRQDLADKEKAELTVLEKYLPAQMSETEVIDKVKEILKKNEVNDFGQAMKLVMAALQGQADGALVKKIVEQELQN